MRDFERPGRSPVRALNGMVASPNPLASLAAIEILRDGGNAIDAAIAAMAVLGVVEALNVGIGGDCFALYAPQGSDRILAYNGSGRSPARAEASWYRAQGFREMPAAGPHSVTIPGAVEAWAHLASQHGTRSLEELLRPAIRYAEEGYPVHDFISFLWRGAVARLTADPEAARIFLWNGVAPAAGTVHRQSDLAATLSRIAREGPSAFYRGPIADAIVKHLASLGGLHVLDDFASHAGDYVTPVSLRYRDHEIFECPPNGQGIAALMMVGLAAGFDLSSLEPFGTDRFHIAVETGRLAILDRDRLVGDPESETNWRRMVDETYLASLRANIDMKIAAPKVSHSPMSMGRDTCHVAVVDRERNAVSLIASVFHDFGSGLVAPTTGVLLQNRGHGFVLTPGHPNELKPRKRPLHTIIPALVCRQGRVSHVLGVVGGHYQAWGHAHVISNLLDFGLDPQAALDAPRVIHDGNVVEAERGIDRRVLDGLRARGHEVRRHEAGDGRAPLGGAQLIEIDWEGGTLVGASDPRLDGCAIGY
jgi:gamma-glutamyltranspeptidase/glutathione hydrolase